MSARRIIVFDVETTGTDRRRDQVIELCVQFGLDGGADSADSATNSANGSPGGNGNSEAERVTWRIKPQVSINPGAQAVHGISAEDLAGCPTFEAFADRFRAIIADADVLVGYNLAFDIDMVQAEYERLGQPRLALEHKLIVDPFRLWQQCEPRTLQDAHRRFVGDTFDAAHSASADVAATGRVLAGMIDRFGLPSGDWGKLALVCEPSRLAWVGSSRHVQWRDGDAVLGFGKHTNASVWELAHGPDAGYLQWIIGKDFPSHVARICRAAIELDRASFDSWLASEFDLGDSGDARETKTSSEPLLEAASEARA